MFDDATAFNQDISTWNVEAVQTMKNMFNGATKFNCFDTIPPGGPNGNIRKWKVNPQLQTDGVTAMFANSKAMDATYNNIPSYDADTGTPTINEFFGQ